MRVWIPTGDGAFVEEALHRGTGLLGRGDVGVERRATSEHVLDDRLGKGLNGLGFIAMVALRAGGRRIASFGV